jgi:hypothetical protein
LEALISAPAEQWVALFVGLMLLPRSEVSHRSRPIASRFTALGGKRLLSPGSGGIRGDDADIFELRPDGPITLMGLLGPAQAG